jgi:hypothetical protein
MRRLFVCVKWSNVSDLPELVFSNSNYIFICIHSPINREFYLAKGTEKFILAIRHIINIVEFATPLILENRGAKSHFWDYFITRARYLYLSYYRKCRACNSLHFLFFFFVRSIVSKFQRVEIENFFYFCTFYSFPHHHRGRAIGCVFFLTWCPQWA